MIKLDIVSKIYYNNGVIGTGFSKISTEFKIGEFVVIVGESGSGKSTLLNVISGLDTYEEGEMYINGEETSHYTNQDFEEYRRKYIANIFQAFNLVNSYTVKQNVELVLLINGKNDKKRIEDILKKVGLWELRNKKVSKLSGGQKQRVAIARALAKETPIIVADEPTGNLDYDSAKQIFALLHEIASDKLVIIVTHNQEQVNQYATRIIRMHDGKMIEDKKIKETDTIKAKEAITHKMTIPAKWTLAFRNAFNVFPKFLIVCCVFLMVTISLFGQYANFKQSEYEEFVQGISEGTFIDAAPERIIISKKDKSIINNKEIDTIKELNNVAKIKENDYIDDLLYVYCTEMYCLEGTIEPLSSLAKKITKGNPSENENEIIIAGNPNYYDLEFTEELWLEKPGDFESFNNSTQTTFPYRIVGAIYDNRETSINTFYVSDNWLKEQQNLELIKYYQFCLTTPDGIKSCDEDNDLNIINFSKKVPRGEIYYPDSANTLCENLNCTNQMITIESTSIYSKRTANFKMTKHYNPTNKKEVIGNEFFSDSYFINPKDLELLFPSDVYQLSVYADNIDNLDKIISKLKEMKYNAYAVKDIDIVEKEMLELFRYMNYIFIFMVLILLFFFSYFVIYMVLKSRTTYFAIIRMLGGNIALSKQLIYLELFIDATIAFLTTLVLTLLTHENIIKITALQTAIKYLNLTQFVIVYLIMIILSLLIARRYAQKIFKSSMITTYGMEG